MVCRTHDASGIDSGRALLLIARVWRTNVLPIGICSRASSSDVSEGKMCKSPPQSNLLCVLSYIDRGSTAGLTHHMVRARSQCSWSCTCHTASGFLPLGWMRDAAVFSCISTPFRHLRLLSLSSLSTCGCHDTLFPHAALKPCSIVP